MADLAAHAVFAADDLLIHDDAAAHAGSQRDHDNIRVAFAAAHPHLAQSCHVGVIAALYRKSVQKPAQRPLGIHVAPS